MAGVLKGFPSNNKTSNQRDLKYANIEPAFLQKDALAVKAYQFARAVGTDAVEAGSTTDTIVATAHAAQAGDIINFTSGSLSGQEFSVQSVSANAIVLSEHASVAPSAADTFQILRHKTPVSDASGNIIVAPSSSGPIQFTRNGATQTVTEDTTTPANNRPLPVKLTGFDGDVSINASNLNLEVQLSHSAAVPDSVRVGDGTDLLAISAAGEASVAVTSALPAGTNNIGDVDVLSVIPGTGATNLGKAEDSVHASGDVGVMALAVRQDASAALAADGDYTPLQTNANGELKVAATFSEQAVFAEDSAHVSGDSGKFVLAVRKDAAGSLVSTDGDYAPLQVDATGNLRVAATIAESAVFAEDSAHSSGDSGKFMLAVRNDASSSLVSTDGDYAPLQVNATGELKVAATFTEQAIFAEDSAHSSGDNLKAVAAVRNDAGTALAGTSGDYIPITTDANGFLWVKPGSQVGRSKVELIRNDYSSTNVTTAAYVQLVASTSAAINLLDVFDSSGETLVFATGAAASEVNQFFIYPGGNGRIELSIPAGTRLSVKAISATASVGELVINSFS